MRFLGIMVTPNWTVSVASGCGKAGRTPDHRQRQCHDQTMQSPFSPPGPLFVEGVPVMARALSERCGKQDTGRARS